VGGSVIRVAADSKTHINALDMSEGYDDGADGVRMKSDFILSLCEQCVGMGKIEAGEKSLIDRAVANIYRNYIREGYRGKAPTLQDFPAELLRFKEAPAKNIALAMELFTSGSLNIFAHQTNVDTKNRIIVYDIRDLGRQLKTIGMLVVLDSIFNRLLRNRAQGRRTWIVVDELYLMFSNEYSATYFYELWKRIRKYGGFATGITQNVTDMLQSHTARSMLANSELLVMLNQSGTDRLELGRLLEITETQLSSITNVQPGRGLIKCGASIVPFEHFIPKGSEYYSLLTTKLGDA
jgi:type IV secretory pathway VirB4 component